MNADERSAVVVVPTELDRRTPFWDLTVLACAVFAIWYLWQNGYSWIWAVPIVLCVSAWTLTGEPACDVSIVGAIASGLRSKLGMRRIHEWIMAWGHYFRIRTWPDGRAAFWRQHKRFVVKGTELWRWSQGTSRGVTICCFGYALRFVTTVRTAMRKS